MTSSNRLGIAMALALTAPIVWGGCGDDDEPEADRLGIGAACEDDEECLEHQQCLGDFKGGYCGVKSCTKNHTDPCPDGEVCCPEASVCVTHTNGTNYCFRQCADKPECNANRPAEVESNCVSSFTPLDPSSKGKVCEPPSGN